uniref:Palmitoyltransferase n=1 Tax=Nyssomyia neivai TaxID=330878 RepID=A0A1L8DY41_9DIPT
MYQSACGAATGGCVKTEHHHSRESNLISHEPAVAPVEHDYSGFDIVKATQYGAIGRVKELIEAGWDVNQPDSETVTLLHWAAINNRKDIIKYFLEKGAVVDAVGGELNATPLHWATRQGHISAVVLLLSAGADPSIRDAEGVSCIHLAAQFGHTALVAYFIARGVNPDLQDRTGMTALMWAAWKVVEIDPVRLLLTLGANPSVVDHTHGNTALHWAILARNATAINTLILKGKASLDIPNLRGDTPLTMLQSQMGAFWISPKVNEKLRDMGQMQQRRNILVRWTVDKRVRWWTMAATPFLVFYLAGLIFSSDLLYIIKFFLLGCLYAVTHTVGRVMFDDHLMTLIPLSVYLATKFWFYVTWFVYIAPAVSAWLTASFVASSGVLWWCFLRSWRGDPGVIRPTHEERMRTIIELSERGGSGFAPPGFCSSCLVRRPVRSKHCSVCDRCVARYDHHCPWIQNCVGIGNHRHFMGFLWALMFMCAWMIYGGAQFYMVQCEVTFEGFWQALMVIGMCQPWVGWVMANALLHMAWVATLALCQTYQIVALGMTTNERMNRDRYKHFQAKGGKSPFTRGYINNFVDFMECTCFGLIKPNRINWMTFFDMDKPQEHEPLLRPTDNYQYV